MRTTASKVLTTLSLAFAVLALGIQSIQAQFTFSHVGGGATGSLIVNGPGSYTINGGGNDVWDQVDEFDYAQFTHTGDFDVRVRVQDVEPVARWSKAGPMVREALDPRSRKAWQRRTPLDVPTGSGGNGAQDNCFSYRTWLPDAGGTGGQHEDGCTSALNNRWTRLQRVGNVINGYHSPDGLTWNSAGSQDTANWVTPEAGATPTPFAATAFLGLAVSRHSGGDTICTVEFREYGNVMTDPAIITRAPQSLVVNHTLPTTMAVFSFEGIGGFDAPTFTVEWMLNGVVDPSLGNGPSISVPGEPANDGKRYSVRYRNNLTGTEQTSPEALLTVISDQVKPTVVSASAGCNTLSANRSVIVRFSEPVEINSAEDEFLYSIPGGPGVSLATRLADQSSVRLDLDSDLAEGASYNVEVGAVLDQSANQNPVEAPNNTASFQGCTFYPGFVHREGFFNIGGGVALNDLLTHPKYVNNTPDHRCATNHWESNFSVDNVCDNCAWRVHGYFVPFVSGDHTFHIAADDGAGLFLSTDANPANKVQIAIEPNWAARREWTGNAPGQGGRNVCVGNICENVSAAINLTAGVRYYMESSVKEGGGGDYVAVAVQGPGQPVPANGSSPINSGQMGAFFPTGAGSASFSSEPADVVASVCGSATFTAAASGTSSECGNFGIYQWFKNGVGIPGATGPSLTTGILTAGDDGTVYRCEFYVPGGRAVSRDALLTVTPDSTPPVCVSGSGTASLSNVVVRFNEQVRQAEAEDEFLWSAPGYNVDLAVLRPDGQSVTLTLSPTPAPGSVITVTVEGQFDCAGNGGSAPCTVTIQSFVVSCGFVRQDNYFNIGGVLVGDLRNDPDYPNNPNLSRLLGEAQINNFDEFDNYGTRMYGFYVPSVSGNYNFYMSSDDAGELWLSTDDNPANIQLIASEPIWNGRRDWLGTARRNAGAPENRSTTLFPGGIPLVAGQFYYFEALMKEGGGGDNLQVTAQGPGDAVPNNGTASSMTGGRIATLADPVGAFVNITRQPCDNFVCKSIQGLPSPNPGGSPLASEDFNAGDGGCTVINNRGPEFEGPWTYNAGSGSWRTAGQGPEIGTPGPSTRLSCPPVAVTQPGNVRISFNHRHSFEGGSWDGGVVQVSINGGPYTTVASAAFVQNGYNGSVLGGSASELAGQSAFVNTQPGYASGTFVTSIADIGCARVGDTVSVRFLAAYDTNTRQGDPAWEIDSVSVVQAVGAIDIATFNVGFAASGQTFIQWKCRPAGGADFVDVPGANSPTLSFSVNLSQNGNCYKAVIYTPGAVTESEVACLTVVQPNTPPSFTKGPDVTGTEDSGSVSIPVWATGIRPHSIPRPTVQDFGAQPPNSTLYGEVGGGTISGGIFRMNTPANSQAGHLVMVSPGGINTYPTFQASWKSYIGDGGGGGADGYSFNVGTDQPGAPGQGIPTYGNPAEDGAGSGLRVTVDTFDNGADSGFPDLGIDIRWQGVKIAHTQINKDAPGNPTFLRRSTFVNASVNVDAAGNATFTYDGVSVAAALPGYSGITANTFSFGGRTGGANDNQWIDDLTGNEWIEPFLPASAATAEAAQSVSFQVVGNSNPGLFSAGPALAPNGTLSYTPAPDACGRAVISIVARDNGGTDACGGTDTSAPCDFVIDIQCVNDCPVGVPGTASTMEDMATGVTLVANDVDGDSLLYLVTLPAHGTLTGALPNPTYTPDPNYCGTDTFLFAAFDGQCSSIPVPVVIQVQCKPDCPTASDQSLTVGEDSTANGVLNASDVDGDALSYAITAPPAHGTLTLGANGAFTYTPAPNYCGPDRFSYSVSDGTCTQPVGATVHITVVCSNDAPTAVIKIHPDCDLSPYFSNKTVIANDVSNAIIRFDGTMSSDPEHDPLTYAWYADGSLTPFSTAAVNSNSLAVGFHIVDLVVNDGSLSGSASCVIQVITPCEAVEVLIGLVENSSLHRRDKRPLIATLKAACAKFERGKCSEGEQLLKAFKNKVRAQLWRNHRALAVQLISLTDRILDCIDCQKKRKGDDDDDDGGGDDDDDDDDDDDGSSGGDDDDD
jgi:hypothetical protein